MQIATAQHNTLAVKIMRFFKDSDIRKNRENTAGNFCVIRFFFSSVFITEASRAE